MYVDHVRLRIVVDVRAQLTYHSAGCRVGVLVGKRHDSSAALQSDLFHPPQYTRRKILSSVNQSVGSGVGGLHQQLAHEHTQPALNQSRPAYCHDLKSSKFIEKYKVKSNKRGKLAGFNVKADPLFFFNIFHNIIIVLTNKMENVRHPIHIRCLRSHLVL